jgi:hypothetical protein
MKKNNTEQLTVLSELVLNDFDLSYRQSAHKHNNDLEELCSTVITLSKALPIVYTAFDGDQFQLCGHMRTFALTRDCVPANPESILGYKDTVSARLNKSGVLRDDLSVLRRCDQLWVFTEKPVDPRSLQSIAEGVVVEILYFLKRQTVPCVYFVSPISLLRGEQPNLLPYEYSYDESKQALHPEQREGVLELANSGGRIDRELPPIAYHIHDPLDFKYAGWLRPRAYQDNYAPLVPGLAVHLRDLGGHLNSLSKILISWARLCDLATHAWVLPSMEHKYSPSIISALLERVWVRTHNASTLRKRQWSEYGIPKAIMGDRWPLTKKEGGIR